MSRRAAPPVPPRPGPPAIDPAAEAQWRTKLDTAWKSLTGAVFERRIAAIHTISEAVDAVAEHPSTLSSPTLLSFITDNAVIDYLLSMKASHAELLKRSQPVLAFAILSRALTDAHLQALSLWLTSDHDHTLSIAQSLLLSLTPLFDLTANIRLYGVMVALVTVESMTVSMLHFLHTFAMRVLTCNDSKTLTQSMADGQWIGLATFWTIIELSNNDRYANTVKPSVSMTAVSLLQSMLRHPCCQSQRDYYAHACVANVRHRIGCDQSLLIMQSIIASFPALVGNKFEPQHHASQAEYVLWLETNYSISNAVIDSACPDTQSPYGHDHGSRQSSASHADANTVANGDELHITLPPHSPVVHVMPTPSLSSSRQSWHTVLMDGHSRSLMTHLNFLLTLCRVSTLTLSMLQAQRLWRDHYHHSNHIHSHRSLFQFLSSLLVIRAKMGNQRTMIGYCVDDSVCLYLLDECLCHIPSHHYDRHAFLTFELYFLHVNHQQNLLSSYDTRAASMTVNSWSLHGIDELWALLVQCREKVVVDSAATLLLKIYHSKSSISQLGANDFIKRCFSYMTSGVQPLASFSAAQVYSPRTPEHSPSPMYDDSDDDNDSEMLSPLSHQSLERLSVGSNGCSTVSPSHGNDLIDGEEDESVRNDRTARCLKLLSLLIKGPIAVTANRPSHTAANTHNGTNNNCGNDSMLVHLQWKATSSSSWSKASLTLPPNTTITVVRQHAAPLLNHPASYIDLMGTATSHYNNKIIADTVLIHTVPTQTQTKTVTLTGVKRPMPDKLQATCLSSVDSPAWLLSQHLQYYQKLYELLAPKHPVILLQSAYSVISGLPVNPTLFTAIIGHQLTWKRSLPFHSPLQLLHTLTIVIDIVTPQLYETETINAAREQWLLIFIDSGGLAHLRDVLLRGMSVDACQSNAWLRCQRLRTFGAIVSLMTDLCHRRLTLAMPIIAECRAAVGMRLFELIAECSVGASILPLFNDATDTLIGDCCVSTVRACFTLLRLLLSHTSADTASNTVLWQHFYSQPFIDTVLQSLTSRHTSVRAVMCSDLIELVRAHQQSLPIFDQPSPFVHFTQTLLAALNVAGSVSIIDSGEYFSLLQSLLTLAAKATITVINEQRGATLVKIITQLIQSQPLAETRTHRSDTLRGILGFAAVLFRSEPSLKDTAGPELVRLLYDDCLFAIDSDTATLVAKARHHETRGQAYQTLLALMLKSPTNTTALLSLIAQAHSQAVIRERAIWELDSESVTVKSHYVGLKNLGNTCYLNAFLQQLTMVPNFAEAVLTMPLTHDSGNDSVLMSNQLYQLQHLFLSLILSNSPSINPQQFVLHFSFFGEPINVSQQYDVQEFSSVLFDNLDEALKATDRRELLASFFGGVIENEIVGLSSCPHRHSKSEPFYLLSLNIQHHRDIQMSLKEFVKGETLAGDNAYHCDQCRAKVDAQRRSVIAKLPDHLILHLKRFEFDFDTMRKKKLNSECAFPLTIDMGKYLKRKDGESGSGGSTDIHTVADSDISDTSDGADGETFTEADTEGASESDNAVRDLYDLVGVIVHSGHADGGHYYAFIKDRFPSTTDTDADCKPYHRSSGQWLQFNDQRIAPFSLNDLATECFGGDETIKVNYSNKEKSLAGDEEYLTVEKQRSAYMLFYERRIKCNDSVRQDDREGEANHINGLQRSSTVGALGSTATVRQPSLPHYLHPLLQSLNTANLALLRAQLANDAQYFNFLFRAFLHSYDSMPRNDLYPTNQTLIARASKPSMAMQFVQAITYYFVHVIVRARSHRRAEAFAAIIQHALALHVPACHWLIEFLSSESLTLRQSLIECSSPTTRRYLMLIVDCALTKLVSFEIDAEYTEKFAMMPIPDKEKERAVMEVEFGAMNAATTPPPVPARKVAGSASPSSVASPLSSPRGSLSEPVPAAAPPAKPLTQVDATLAPDNMFKVKSKVSLASPLTVLHGLGASTAKTLANAGVNTIQLLAGVRDRKKKEQSLLLSQTKLSPKQLTEAVDKARTACAFIQQIGGDAMEIKLSTSVTCDAGNSKPEVPKRPINANYVGLTPLAVIPRFIHQCLAMLRGLVEVGGAEGVSSIESVELLARFAKKSPLCARLLIEAGCIETLIALFTGESPSSTAVATTDTPGNSQVNDASRTNGNGTVGGEASMVESLSNDSDLPPLPLLPTQSAAVNSRSNPYDPSYDQSGTLALLTTLVKSCRLPHWSDNQSPASFVPTTAGASVTLSSATHAKLTGSLFLDKLAYQTAARVSVMAVNVELACYLCYLDVDASDRVIASLLSVLAESDAESGWCCLSLIQGLLTLGDSEDYVSHRTDTVISTLLRQLYENSGYYKLTELSLRWLLSLMAVHPVLASHVYDAIHGGQLDWVTGWLANVKKPPTRQQPIFLNDGRIISLFRQLTPSDSGTGGGSASVEDNFPLSVSDIHKGWKAAMDSATKREQERAKATSGTNSAEVSRRDSSR